MTGLFIFALTYLLIAVQRLPFVRLNRPAAVCWGPWRWSCSESCRSPMRTQPSTST